MTLSDSSSTSLPCARHDTNMRIQFRLKLVTYTVGRMLERRVEGLGEGRLRRHRGRRRTTEAGWHFFARRTDRMRPGGSFTRAQCAWDSRWMHSPAHACVLGLCRILGRTVAGQRAAQTHARACGLWILRIFTSRFRSVIGQRAARHQQIPAHACGLGHCPRSTRHSSLLTIVQRDDLLNMTKAGTCKPCWLLRVVLEKNGDLTCFTTKVAR